MSRKETLDMTLRSLGAAFVLFVAVQSAAAADVGFRGWGPRVGVSEDPDQVFAGAHFDLGEFTKNLRWQPSVELGVGDDRVALYGNFMVAYYFPVKAAVTPYAGAQVVAAFLDYDPDPADPGNGNGNNDDLEDGFNVEVGLAAVGGIETKLKSGTRFLAELQVGVADAPDLRVLVGWTF